MTGKYHFPDLGEIISFNHHGVIMTFLGKTLNKQWNRKYYCRIELQFGSGFHSNPHCHCTEKHALTTVEGQGFSENFSLAVLPFQC